MQSDSTPLSDEERRAREREYSRQYRRRHPDRKRATGQKYRKTHRVAVAEHQRQVRAAQMALKPPKDPAYEIDGDIARVFLRGKGGVLKAVAIIDAVDVPIVGKWRWQLASNGYARRMRWTGEGYEVLSLHRAILGLTKSDDDKDGDHIDRDKLNNLRSNLRAVPRGTNQQNVDAHRDGSSRFRGVRWHPVEKKWYAQAIMGRKAFHIGRFDNEEEAAAAAAQWRAAHMPYSAEALESSA